MGWDGNRGDLNVVDEENEIFKMLLLPRCALIAFGGFSRALRKKIPHSGLREG